MSFLSPWFLLALAGLAVPVLLHLARRRTRKEAVWSSLRFLAPAPPRLERRRRLEHWLLLVLRAGVLALLAAAFARPFFLRPPPALAPAGGATRLLLVDLSASMRREGLFAAALDKVRAQIRRAEPGDRLAIVGFGARPRTLLGFEEWSAAGDRAAARAEERLGALLPGWEGTDLGAALVSAAELVLDDAAAGSGRARPRAEEVVLVSDLQAGASLGALGPAEWPARIALLVERVGGAEVNLGLAAVAPAPGDTGDGATRVRVSASGEGGPLTARLVWEDAASAPVEVSLPPGEARVLAAPARPAGSPPGGVLTVTGDAADFDNRLFVAPVAPERSLVVYVGADDAKDATRGLYFVSRAFAAMTTRTRAPELSAFRPDDAALLTALPRADLVLLAAAPPAAARAALGAVTAAGKTVVIAPPDAETGRALAAFAGGPLAGATFREAPAAREAVLTAVDLTHPLLAPFAEARAGDFTRIRFWRHRRIDLGAAAGARVLARFDDGSPAWTVLPVGRGQIFLMSTSFAAEDSQLGLSSKLVPLLAGLLDSGGRGLGAGSAPLVVGDALPIAPARPGDPPVTLLRPNGQRNEVAAGSAIIAEAPGFHQVTRGVDRAVLAVNLPPAESLTAPLPLEALERAGIKLRETAAGPAPTPVAADPRARTAAFHAQLESEQRPWRFVLAAALLLLVAEALLAARATRRAEVTS